MMNLNPSRAGDVPLVISLEVHDAMVAHCRNDAPLEACGLLSGPPHRGSSIHPLRNSLSSSVRYLADPNDIIAAVTAIRAAKTEMLAIYHSHPESAAIPSKVDLAENHYGDLPRIIVSLRGETPEVRVWRLGESSFEELTWRLDVEHGEKKP
jgi:[CysO sulfur-carrier protein]-S-L-cysteine hydrolase